MIVTGDRDMFQLIEPGVRGDGHEPRHHRDEDLRPRGGDRPLRHPARADPRLLRPEGRHLGQHPGRPRHRRQDRVAAAAASSATSRPCSRSVDKISGAKRKQNLTNHADDARVSKQLATAIRDVPVDVDLEETAAQEPDRSRAARGLPRAGAARPAAPARGGSSATRRRPRRAARHERRHRGGGRRPIDLDGAAGVARHARGRARSARRSPSTRSRCASPSTRAAEALVGGTRRRLAAAHRARRPRRSSPTTGSRSHRRGAVDSRRSSTTRWSPPT